jgi:hypothetical protein
MTVAESTSTTITQEIPNAGIKLIYVKGTSAADNDTITVDGLATVKGAFLQGYAANSVATTGTAATMTFATNVITLTNGGTATWSGIVWGY